ncbi:hypothetical protein KIN20_001091 [Parelaphostrongylus tenuis]|uniref:Uncharacterized protein n=1 Tax=Parelaphostrongylus tenuis TaxID=148309 RepID=A0AAD5QGP9_PARTN|nr:hypothetical protein KIN20_001091 [Parelaphostrongylus tenuis]
MNTREKNLKWENETSTDTFLSDSCPRHVSSMKKAPRATFEPLKEATDQTDPKRAHLSDSTALLELCYGAETRADTPQDSYEQLTERLNDVF